MYHNNYMAIETIDIGSDLNDEKPIFKKSTMKKTFFIIFTSRF